MCSRSEATLNLIGNMLTGFSVNLFSSIEQAQHYLQTYTNNGSDLDFVILDDQSEMNADNLDQYLHSCGKREFLETKVIQLYTPTANPGHPVFGNNTSGVVKMTKPPRLARVLQTLASLKNLPHPTISHHPSEVTKALEDISTAQRTLYGTVLIAEGISNNHLNTRMKI